MRLKAGPTHKSAAGLAGGPKGGQTIWRSRKRCRAPSGRSQHLGRHTYQPARLLLQDSSKISTNDGVPGVCPPTAVALQGIIKIQCIG